VYLTADGIRVCVTPEECFEVRDVELVGPRVATFSVDGQPIADRLGRPGLPVIVGTAGTRLVVAYAPVSSDGLVTFVEVLSANDETFDLSTAVYVAPDGTQTPVAPDRSVGAVDGLIKGDRTVMLFFPAAQPGGEVRFLVRPALGGTPLAAVVPVGTFETPAASD
jgi:hypothetical protein